MANLVQQAYDIAFSMLKPGISSSDVATAVDSFFDSKGYFMPHSLGHGIGLAAHEAPTLRTLKTYEMELAPGMVVTIEPGLYHPEAGGVRLENDFLITESGCEALTHCRILYTHG
jgi:Xaa-Pro aminopeptidase